MNFRIKDLIFNLGFNIYKTDSIIGIGSVCQDNKHILLLDLDSMSEKVARNNLIYLQNKFKLSNALLLKSSENNYHGVFFDKMDFMKTINIQSLVNRQTSGVALIKGDNTLRLSSKFTNKIKFVAFIESNFNNYEISKAHLLAFIEHLKLNINFKSLFLRLDDSNKVKYYCYEKRVKL